MTRPLAIDLFCGLGGWTEGLLAEGYRVVGFDVERHEYPMVIHSTDEGMKLPAGNSRPRWADRPIQRLADASKGCDVVGWAKYPAQLVLQDVLTIHGKQFKDAALIVASPPCQEYSYMAMPWSKAKQKAVEYRNGTRDVKQLTALFDACFRIQREASEAAGHHIPMVVENVRGAQPWVGRSRWNFGSFHLWGDVPALMPIARHLKGAGYNMNKGTDKKWNTHESGFSAIAAGVLVGIKQGGISGPRENGKGDAWFQDGAAKHGSKSNARKAASAMIAKIPFVLSSWVAKTYHPERVA